MIPYLKWMVGRSIQEIEKKDFTWFFRFDDGTVIATEDCWRLVSAGGIVVTSEDHEQQFGLNSPVNAADRVKSEMDGKTVAHVEVDRYTGDLTLAVPPMFLTFLCLSSGYEAWRLSHGDVEFVSTGGGKLVEIRE